MAQKPSKLKKMRMPKEESAPEYDFEMESASEGEHEMPSGEMMADEEMGAEAPSSEEPAPPPQLDEVSDDELMAEIRKRGLMSQLEQSEESAESDLMS